MDAYCVIRLYRNDNITYGHRSTQSPLYVQSVLEGATGMRYISYWGTANYTPGSWRKRYKAGRSTDIDLKPLLDVFEKIDRMNTSMSSRSTSRSQSTSSEESIPLKLNMYSQKQTNTRNGDDIHQRSNNNSNSHDNKFTSVVVTNNNNQADNNIRSNVNDPKKETRVDEVCDETCGDSCVKHTHLNTLDTNFDTKHEVISTECITPYIQNEAEEVKSPDRQDVFQIVEHNINSSPNKSFVNLSYEEGLTTDDCGMQMSSTADDILISTSGKQLNTDDNIQNNNVFSDKENNSKHLNNINANFIWTAERRKRVLPNDPVVSSISSMSYSASTTSSSTFEAVHTTHNDSFIEDQEKVERLLHANKEYNNISKLAMNAIKQVTNDHQAGTSQPPFQTANSTRKVQQYSEIANTTEKPHADKVEDCDFNAYRYLKQKMESLNERRNTVRRESLKTVTSEAFRNNNIPVMHNPKLSTTRHDGKWTAANDISYLLGSELEDDIFDTETESTDEIHSSTSISLSASGGKWKPSLNLSSDSCDFSDDEDEIKDNANTLNQNQTTELERSKTPLSENKKCSDTELYTSETKSITNSSSRPVDIDKKNRDGKAATSHRVKKINHWNDYKNRTPSNQTHMSSVNTNLTETKYFRDETRPYKRSTRTVKNNLSESDEEDPHDAITKLDVSRKDEHELNWRTRGYNTDFYMSRCSVTGGEILERYKNALSNRRRRDKMNDDRSRTSKRSTARVSRLSQMMKENLDPVSFNKQSVSILSRNSSRTLSTEQVKEVLQKAEACSTRMADRLDRLNNQLGC